MLRDHCRVEITWGFCNRYRRALQTVKTLKCRYSVDVICHDFTRSLQCLLSQKQIAAPVVTALSKLKKTNMDSCLKQMDSKGREVLLQYVFYGFQSQPKSATEFLHWHQAIVKMDGIGAIVRVATNIKRNILVSAEYVSLFPSSIPPLRSLCVQSLVLPPQRYNGGMKRVANWRLFCVMVNELLFSWNRIFVSTVRLPTHCHFGTLHKMFLQYASRETLNSLSMKWCAFESFRRFLLLK